MATRRPDLEALEYQRPQSISDIVLPPLWKMNKLGRLFYRPVRVDRTGQTNRVLGDAPTRNKRTPVSVTFSLSEAINRESVDDSDIPQLDGGLSTWQQDMALSGKYAVANILEARTATAVFGAVGDTITAVPLGDNILQTVFTVKSAIQNLGVDGQVVVFGANEVIDRLRFLAEITNRMLYTGVDPADARLVRALADSELAKILNVDRIVRGPNTAWLGTASAYDGYVGVMVATPGDNPNSQPQFGRNILLDFRGEGAGAPSAMTVSSWHSDEWVSEVLDVQAFNEAKILNPSLCQVITGVTVDQTT